MNISGFDHLLVSQKSIFDLKDSLIHEARKIWPECIVDIEEDEERQMLWLFFAKDKNMLEDEERAYDLDGNGEGCFSIIGSKLNGFNATVALPNFQRAIASEVKMILNDFWSYTLILPERIDYNSFTRKIYNILISALSTDITVSRTEYQNALIPRPVQDFI